MLEYHYHPQSHCTRARVILLLWSRPFFLLFASVTASQKRVVVKASLDEPMFIRNNRSQNRRRKCWKHLCNFSEKDFGFNVAFANGLYGSFRSLR